MSFRWNEAREILERTPTILNTLLAGITPAWLTSRENTSTWNAVEVLGHLIQGERDDWVPRVRRILEHGVAVAFDPFERDAHLQWCRNRSIVTLLDEFTELRATNLRVLDQLDVDASKLRLRGTHPTFGPVTLEQLLSTWVVHDLNHLNQITRALAARYRECVGPWNHRSFLRILNGD